MAKQQRKTLLFFCSKFYVKIGKIEHLKKVGFKKPKKIFKKSLDKSENMVYNNHKMVKDNQITRRRSTLDRTEIEELRKINIDDLAWTITAACRSSATLDEDLYIYAAAYALLRIKEDQTIKFEKLEDFIASSGISESRSLFFRNVLHKKWIPIISIIDKFTVDELKALLLFYEPTGKIYSDSTPVGVARLAAKILNIHDGDRVADFCTGKGSFIRECMSYNPNAKYYGNDIDTKAIEIASMRAEILGGDITIVQEDVFNMKDKNLHFDAAFANYPFGMRQKEAWLHGFNQNEEFLHWQEFAKVQSLDWIFNKKTSTAAPLRSICIMTNGSTWNTLDKEARKHFVAGGGVEAVIALPNNLFPNTTIGTVMIIFSHGNTSTMMVDARQMCTTGRRFNTFTDFNISMIQLALNEECEFSRRVSTEELAENDYVLNPVRYLTEAVTVDNGVPFETVIKRITRGAPLNASNLDELSSNIATDTQYLMLSNIKDGIIDDDLPYLKGIEKNQEKYCIKNNSLIISKNGYPYKVAVAEVSDNRRILGNGNLFIIELDEEKVNPYFIKAYLESDIGVAALKSITVGATIPNIGIEQLKKITVPCPPLKEQKLIADKYMMLVDEIKLLRRKMNKATTNLKHLFDESKED